MRKHVGNIFVNIFRRKTPYTPPPKVQVELTPLEAVN